MKWIEIHVGSGHPSLEIGFGILDLRPIANRQSKIAPIANPTSKIPKWDAWDVPLDEIQAVTKQFVLANCLNPDIVSARFDNRT